MLRRIPVFIGLSGLATQTAISPNQTADLPLQPLCVSCLPDGDQMKSSADDNKKHGTKTQCEWGLSMMAPLFLSSHTIITTPQCKQLLKARPCVSTFIPLMMVLFNTPSVKTQLTVTEDRVQSSSVCEIHPQREFSKTFTLMFTFCSSSLSHTVIHLTHCKDRLNSYSPEVTRSSKHKVNTAIKIVQFCDSLCDSNKEACVYQTAYKSWVIFTRHLRVNLTDKKCQHWLILLMFMSSLM